MKLGIYGAGSLGVVLGAFITKAGFPIDLIHHRAEHVQALQDYGARVEGTVSMTIPVHALHTSDMKDQYDILFLTTKQQDNPAVVASLLPYLREDGAICTLQNGLPEPGIAEIVGAKRTLGCVVEWGATLIAPGISRLTSEPSSLSFSLGGLTPLSSGKVMQAKHVLESMCAVSIEENFIGVRWSKLLINAAFSGMSAVLGSTFGEAAKDGRSRECVQRIIKECIDVSRAEGVQICPVQGKDIAKLLDYTNPIKKKISLLIIPIAIKKHSMIRASMLQDLEKNRLTEVDSINGIVCGHGRKVSIPTPYNDRVVEIIHGIEQGRHQPAFENVSLFPN